MEQRVKYCLITRGCFHNGEEKWTGKIMSRTRVVERYTFTCDPIHGPSGLLSYEHFIKFAAMEYFAASDARDGMVRSCEILAGGFGQYVTCQDSPEIRLVYLLSNLLNLSFVAQDRRNFIRLVYIIPARLHVSPFLVGTVNTSRKPLWACQLPDPYRRVGEAIHIY